MKTVELADASRRLGDYARQARRKPVVITRNGRPYVALTSMASSDWENLVVSSDPRFVALIERSRASCPAGSGLSSDDVRRLLATRDAATGSPGSRSRASGVKLRKQAGERAAGVPSRRRGK